MKYHVDEVTIEDLDVIISLKIKMFEDAKLLHLLKDNCRGGIKTKYTQLFIDGFMKHFVVKVNDRVIAMSGAFIKDDIPYCFYKDDRYGFIGDMYTLTEFRREGIAQLLLSASVNWLKKQGITSIQLLASEQGKELYKRNGFIERPECMILTL